MKYLSMMLTVLMCTMTALAVPQQINYQGHLADTSGTALDTTVDVTFNFYTSPASGSPLWTETHSGISVANGLFNVKLGETTTLNDAILNQTELWLGITVGGDAEMTPREQIVSVGYAYRVGTVDGASGGTITGDVIINNKLNVGPSNTNEGGAANVLGAHNHARGAYSVVCGGGGPGVSDSNSTSGICSAIAGGRRNIANGNNTTVSGGSGNAATAEAASVGGGANNTASGGYARVGGGTGNSATQTQATVAGGATNSATAGVSTVGGGISNIASGGGSTVSGGVSNEASGTNSTVGGGRYNFARGDYSVIAGGGGGGLADSNSAIGTASAIGGGRRNLTTVLYATVPGGHENQATGLFSFAAGRRARANHTGAFVWGSSSSGTDSTASFNDYTFTVRAPNGARFYTAQAGTAIGVELAQGGGSWANLCDVNQKNLHGHVNTSAVLQKVASLPLYDWSYKSQRDDIRHVGPTAQDFYAAFGLGDNNTTITTVDPDGVLFAAVQELAKRTERIEELEARVQHLESVILQFGQLTNEDKNDRN